MRQGYKQNKLQSLYRINHQINAAQVRVLDDSGKQIDVMDIAKARAMAAESELDLVEIARNAVPPVVKLIDYRKFLYQLKKKKQEEKKSNKTSETKEIRMGPFIGAHDLEIKLKKAREFFEDGDKVRFVVRFPGRAITRKEIGEKVLKGIVETLKEAAKIEKEIHMEGRQMVMIMSRLK